MINLETFWKVSWRNVLVGLAYLAGLLIAGLLGAMLGLQPAAEAGRGSSLLQLFVASLLLGVFLGPYASRLALSRWQHFILWGSLILFNIGSVAIEGAYFAPDLVKMPVPVLAAQQLVATAAAAFVITRLSSPSEHATSWAEALGRHPWYSWTWRFLASALSYLFFYLVIGGLNYQLVTKPYYESHAGGLTVPAPGVVLLVESIRSLLIVFSVFLFLLSARGTTRQLQARTGWLLFAVGGIIPLIWQIGTLPPFLLAASAVEIFFQNFLTGAVAAWLLGIRDTG